MCDVEITVDSDTTVTIRIKENASVLHEAMYQEIRDAEGYREYGKMLKEMQGYTLSAYPYRQDKMRGFLFEYGRNWYAIPRNLVELA